MSKNQNNSDFWLYNNLNMSQSQPQQHIKIKGYIYVLIENFNL